MSTNSSGIHILAGDARIDESERGGWDEVEMARVFIVTISNRSILFNYYLSAVQLGSLHKIIFVK